jgi:DNA-binding Lrp family transcriptional regulator
VAASIEQIEGLVSAFTLSGDADALVRLRLRSVDALQELVGRLRPDRNILRTKTMLMLSVVR